MQYIRKDLQLGSQKNDDEISHRREGEWKVGVSAGEETYIPMFPPGWASPEEQEEEEGEPTPS